MEKESKSRYIVLQFSINLHVKAVVFQMHALHWQQRIPTECLSIFLIPLQEVKMALFTPHLTAVAYSPLQEPREIT